MTELLQQPILGIENDWPETLYVVQHVATNRYGCYCHRGVHGLACFTSEAGAMQFGEILDMPGMAAMQVSFDEARELAKMRPLPVVSVMLLDDMTDPLIHFVR